MSMCSNCGSDWCSGVDCIKEPLKKIRDEILMSSCSDPGFDTNRKLKADWAHRLSVLIGDKK